MNKIFLAVLLVLFQGLFGVAHAQTVSSLGETTPAKSVILVHITARNNAFDAGFDTGGQMLDGLTEKELNKKFARATSAAAIINFVLLHGYRIEGFSMIEARTHNGVGLAGGGSSGYAILFGRVR